jgi:trigger factor
MQKNGGQDAVFCVKVHEVKEKQLPEADDEFAQDVSEFDTLDEYKKDIKKRLKKQAGDKSKVEVENQVLEAVAKNAVIDIPEVMVDTQIDNQIQQMSYQLMYQGIKLEDYLRYMGNTMDDLRRSYKVSAEEQVRMRLAVEALISKLGIEPTPEETEKRMEEMAKEAGKSLQEYKNMLGNEELEYFGDRVAMEKLFDYLVEKAETEEMDGAAYNKEKEEKQKEAAAKALEKEKAEKAPAAKKTAAKKSAAKAPAKKETDKKAPAKKADKKDTAAKETKTAAKKKTEDSE